MRFDTNFILFCIIYEVEHPGHLHVSLTVATDKLLSVYPFWSVLFPRVYTGADVIILYMNANDILNNNPCSLSGLISIAIQVYVCYAQYSWVAGK